MMQIENYLKRREALEQAKRDKEEAKAKGLDHVELDDEDFIANRERIEQEKLADQRIYNGEVEDDE